METLYTWLDRSPKYQYSEDLFFILIESKEKNISYDFVIYKKVFDTLLNKLKDDSLINSYQMIHSHSISRPTYHSYRKNEIDNIILCLENITDNSSNGQKFFNNIHIHSLNILEKYGATRLLEKNNISLNTKVYQNLKLNQLCNSKYQTEWTQQSLHDFIEEVKELTKIASPEIVFNLKNNIGFFCASIALGYQPSQKDIYTVFEKTWNNLTKNSLHLHFFCEYFAQTNVFIHSLAPAKSIDKLLKKFFNHLLTPNNNPNIPSSSLMPFEEKLHILFNHPSFLYQNIQKHFIREHSKELLGKANINKEEEIIVVNDMNLNKEVSSKPKRMKI